MRPDRPDRQYNSMAEKFDHEKSSSHLGNIFRWTGIAVALIAIAGGFWLAHKWIHFSWSSDWFLPLGLAVGALLALWLLWRVPQWQVESVKNLEPEERFNSENEARRTLATILGGVVLLAGFFATWRNIKLAQESLTVSQKALAISQEGQITDRFAKAIEQLGAVDAKGEKRLEVRLGGIYALERIADESERDHWPIMEVLCTYVRENAPRNSHESTQKKQALKETLRPEADVQAILTVVGRRDRKYEQKDQKLDLSNTNLRGASLDSADLRGASLDSTDLREASLESADMQGALLHDADLQGAHLTAAKLSGAQLSGAQLSWAFLRSADLSMTNLRGADLRGAQLHEADLRAAELIHADLSATNLFHANLTGADFGETDLSNAESLTQEQIDSASGDINTRLPDGLRMPEAWTNSRR